MRNRWKAIRPVIRKGVREDRKTGGVGVGVARKGKGTFLTATSETSHFREGKTPLAYPVPFSPLPERIASVSNEFYQPTSIHTIPLPHLQGSTLTGHNYIVHREKRDQLHPHPHRMKRILKRSFSCGLFQNVRST